MKKSMILGLLFIFFVSCQNEGSNELACEKLDAHCVGNSRVYCENGKERTELCLDNFICEGGLCVPKSSCNVSSFVKRCVENSEILCIDSVIVQRPCSDGYACENGSCAPSPTCEDENLSPRCEGNTAISCNGGKIQRVTCEHPMRCVKGACEEISEGCGNGQLEDGEFCDDGQENGIYGKCRLDCQSIAECGDATIDEGHELCDDGAVNGLQGKCKNDCQGFSICGDGILDETWEECEPNLENWLDACTKECKKVETIFEAYPRNEDFLQSDKECRDEDFLGKYLRYRERFLGNAEKNLSGFISWGTNPGESLPSSHRIPSANCATQWDLNSCEYKDLPDAQGAYKWGDTTMWLGIMIHWLATEYKVFELLGLDTTQTKRYIALSMKAFDRLDEAAERYFGLPSVLDGFFMREDLPHDFYLLNGKYRFTRQDGQNKGYECASSGASCERFQGVPGEEYLKGGGFVSQDQITGLFEGYAMLAKLLPQSAQAEGLALRDHARTSLHRMMGALTRRSWVLGIEVNGKWIQIPDEWGGLALTFSGLFAEAADNILGKDFGVETYHDSVSTLALENTKVALNFAWPLWESGNNYNRNLVLRMIAYTNVWDSAEYNNRSLESGRDTLAMMRAIIWGEALSDSFPLWRAGYILSTAPCQGPCRDANCGSEKVAWRGENFFVTPNDRYGSRHWSGEFNGLDYLLLHNLYFLSYAKKMGQAYSQILPMPSQTGGDLSALLSGDKSITTFDAHDPKNARDLNMIFCGRPFGDWIRDSAKGWVDIYTETNLWNCDISGACEISSDANPYTRKNALILGTESDDNMQIPRTHHHCVASLGGDDNIETAGGFHVIEAGDGNDIIRTSGGGHVFIHAGNGNDKIYAGPGFHQIEAGDGDDLIEGGVGTNLISGGEGHDTIHAGSGSNTILGGRGNDYITALDGNNVVWAGDGDDKVKLGNGDNAIWGEEGRSFILLGNGNNLVGSQEVQDEDLYICFGSGKNTIWAGWSTFSHCSSAQNSNLNNSCTADLTTEFCSLENFMLWK